MGSVERRYMESISSLNKIKVPKPHKVAAILLIVITMVIFALLALTPWVQTAQGSGEVNTLDPRDRTQAISALVDGQIQEWHVREGQRVKAGDPIVTLIDRDKALVERLQSQLMAAKQRHQANLSAITKVESNLARQKVLLGEGLVSQRDLEMVEIRLDDLVAKASSSEAKVSEISVSLARQSIQTKVAPQNGTILRLVSAGNSTFVKSGEVLAWFIPDGVQRSVVMKVSGLDAPLVMKGRKVRLQFEGWPVFQFSGAPDIALGTFGGIVDFVEPVADQNGQFNVWVSPDPDDYGWPNENYVRLGSRVKGWVLLEEVKLGYEIWRQLNNFPPKRAQGAANAN